MTEAATPQEIWGWAMSELRCGMTRTTFETWVKDTQAIGWEDGRFVIGVRNEYAKNWLEDRLRDTIERALVGIVGRSVEVTFLVAPEIFRQTRPVAETERGVVKDLEKKKDLVAVKLYEYDPMRRGYLMMPKYCEWFWQPYLGSVAYATYRFLRSLDKQNEGWGKWHFVTVERIAATVADGNRQQITGVQRKKKDGGGRYWQPGAFDRLAKAGVARIERLGNGKNLSYRVLCLNSLPLLTPEQVKTLSVILQEEHAEFIKECDIERKEWEQLELPTLVPQK